MLCFTDKLNNMSGMLCLFDFRPIRDIFSKLALDEELPIRL